MSKAISDLEHEHEAILTALKIMEKMVSASADDTSDLLKTDILSFMTFLKEFADKCHHGKEEGILFPALKESGIPEKNGPIEVLLAEHSEGRTLIKNMEENVAGVFKQIEFATIAREYINLLRNHIQKENEVLFPMAERTLAPARLEKIYQLFEAHEEEVIGHGRHEELHKILKKLKLKYGG